MEMTQQEQIEAYIEGRLSDEQRAAFEAQMATDEALSREVGMEKFMRKGLKALAYKEAFRKIHQDIAETPVVPLGEQTQQRNAGVFKIEQNKSSFRSYYYAVAACLAAVVAGVWYFQLNEPATDLASNTPKEQVEKPADNPTNQSDQNLLSEKQNAIDLSLNPEECEELFQKYLNENPVTDQALTEGIEATKQGKDGVSIFRKIKNETTDKSLQQKAEWLMALANLKNCKIKEALKLAESMSKTEGHLYRIQAKKLYNRLR